MFELVNLLHHELANFSLLANIFSLKPSVVVSTFQEERINAIDFLLNDDCWMTKVLPFVKIDNRKTTSLKTKMTLLLTLDGKIFPRELTC